MNLTGHPNFQDEELYIGLFFDYLHKTCVIVIIPLYTKPAADAKNC